MLDAQHQSVSLFNILNENTKIYVKKDLLKIDLAIVKSMKKLYCMVILSEL